MATVTLTSAPVLAPTLAPAELAIGDQRVVFTAVGWDGYQALLKIRGERLRPQMMYIDGDVFLVTTSHMHEWLTDRLGMFVRLVVEELDIPCVPTRETTFHRDDQDVGVQPDDSFYLANYRVIAIKDGRKHIDLRVDPPPDLVIEVVHTHKATHALEVLRRLRVPEVWVGKREGLNILVLSDEGQYIESASSVCFPLLTAAEIFDWVSRPDMDSMTQWIKELRQWARETLVPRRQG